MTPVIFAIIAAVGWAIADIFGGLVARKIGGYSSAILSYIISILLTTLYVPFAWHELNGITTASLIWLVVLTPIGIIPLISLYEGFKVGNPSLIGTIASAFGGLVAILSVIFLGERLTIFQILAIAAITIGIATSSLELKGLSSKKILSDKGIPFALASLLSWGIYYTFVKIPLQNIGWFWPTYLSYWGFPLVLIFMRMRNIKLVVPTDKKIIFFTLINGILLTLSFFSVNYALTLGQSSVVSPISSSYPALFALMAYFVFRDRLSKQQILGIVVTLAGVLSLSLTS